MTIKKGEPWGRPAPLGPLGVLVNSDVEARAAVLGAKAADLGPPTLGLLGGDLCRTLGGQGREDRLRSPEATTLPVDLVSAVIDGTQQWFVSHLLARSRWWGRVVLAMNAQWLTNSQAGPWNVAPRAHPNDGLVDVFEAELTLGDRWKMRRRLPLGTHLPHPRVAVRRGRSVTVELARPLPIWVDGVPIGLGRQMVLTVVPDALEVVI